jgi:cytochrome c biogenesis protein CcmG, thiol:disulfide interchange protein DsbE
MRFIQIAAVVALAGAAAAVFVHARAPVPGSRGAGGSSSTAATPGVSTQQFAPAPDLDVVMYQGEAAVGGSRVRLSHLWGKGRPVVLNFFAGLCPPCRGELPDFQRLYTEHARGRFTLIAVDIGPFVGLGSRDDGRALLHELKIDFPAGTTMAAAPVRAYGILGMPTTIFVTSDGKIFAKYVGKLTLGQMESFAERLLKVSGTP